MKINVTERNIQVSDAIRDYAVTKVRGLTRYFDGIISADITLKVEKERESCEIVAHLIKNKIVKATAESEDLYVSMDSALDKIKRQVKKYKGKIKDKDLPSDVEIATDDRISTDSGQIKRRPLSLEKPMTPKEAVMKLENNQYKFLIFMDSERDSISVAHQLDNGNYEILEPVR